MMKTNNYKLLKFIDLLVFFLGLFSFFPLIRAISFFNQLWFLFLVLLVLSLLIASKRNRYLKIPKLVFYIIFYVIYAVGLSLISGNYFIANRFLELSQAPIFYLAFLHNKNLNRNIYNYKIIKLLLPFIILTCILTLKAYQSSPYISRAIKSSGVESSEILSSGVGGYEFIYFLVFIFTILIFSFKSINFKKHLIKLRLLMVFLVLLTGYNVILSGYTTALFLIVLVIILRTIGEFISLSKLNSLIIYLFLYAPLIFLGLNFTLNYYLENFGKTGNAIKILEVISFFNSDTLGLTSQARVEVYQKSISVFKNNPFFGIISQPLPVDSSGKLIAFGQHSQILDTMALFGIPFGLFQLYIYLKPLKDRITIGYKKYNMLTIATILCFLVISIFNNLTPSIGFAVFFIFPTINVIINKNKF